MDYSIKHAYLSHPNLIHFLPLPLSSTKTSGTMLKYTTFLCVFIYPTGFIVFAEKVRDAR
tara:strand:+ start:6288 stop:6467 length:180 start_codon:yes stop_codon:yes gene_type:complete